MNASQPEPSNPLIATMLRWLRVSAAGGPGRTKALGNRGERIAARHLRGLGFRVVARNLVMGNAEADLVCLDRDRRTVVVVEVKTRRASDTDPGQARSPEAAITEHKQAKLRQLARTLARRRRWAGRPVRIDVVAIVVEPTGRAVVRHYRDAVR